MALSGTIQGTVTNRGDHFSYYLVWSAEQSIADNCSYVSVAAYWETNNVAYTFDTVGKRKASITIDGDKTEVYQRFDCNPWASDGVYRIMSFDRKKVVHSGNGTKTITISASADGSANSGDIHYGPSYNSSQPCTASATITLDAIPRYATIVSAQDFTDNGNPEIIYTNPIGEAVSSLEACISFLGFTDDISYRSIPKSGGTYRFNLTDSERDILRNGTTTASRIVRFVVKTVINGVTFTDSNSRTLTIQETDQTRPSVSISVSPNNGSLPVKFNSAYIQGKTKVNASVTASGKYGATIIATTTKVAGRIYDADEEINESGDIAVTTTVTDSRGQTNTATQTISVLPYRTPAVIGISGESSAICYRSDAEGNPKDDSTVLWIKAKKSFYPLIVDGSPKNLCRLRWRYKYAYSQTYGEWSELTTQNNEYNDSVVVSFPITEAFIIQIGVVDDIGEETILTFDVPKFNPTFHLGRGGTAIGVGQYADTSYMNSFTVAEDWTARFLGGYEGTHNQILVEGNILSFAQSCKNGVTPIATSGLTEGIPSIAQGLFDMSSGFVLKRYDTKITIILFDYVTGKIATNTFNNSTWTGWKYITPQ